MPEKNLLFVQLQGNFYIYIIYAIKFGKYYKNAFILVNKTRHER